MSLSKPLLFSDVAALLDGGGMRSDDGIEKNAWEEELIAWLKPVDTEEEELGNRALAITAM